MSPDHRPGQGASRYRRRHRRPRISRAERRIAAACQSHPGLVESGQPVKRIVQAGLNAGKIVIAALGNEMRLADHREAEPGNPGDMDIGGDAAMLDPVAVHHASCFERGEGEDQLGFGGAVRGDGAVLSMSCADEFHGLIKAGKSVFVEVKLGRSELPIWGRRASAEQQVSRYDAVLLQITHFGLRREVRCHHRIVAR